MGPGSPSLRFRLRLLGYGGQAVVRDDSGANGLALMPALRHGAAYFTGKNIRVDGGLTRAI